MFPVTGRRVTKSLLYIYFIVVDTSVGIQIPDSDYLNVSGCGMVRIMIPIEYRKGKNICPAFKWSKKMASKVIFNTHAPLCSPNDWT